MNISSVESNERGRDASSAAFSIQRVQPMDHQSSFSQSLQSDPMNVCHSILKSEVSTPKEQEGRPSVFPLLANTSSVPQEVRNQFPWIAAQHPFSPSAHEDFQTIRTPTSSSELLFSPSDIGSKKRSQNFLGLSSKKAMKQEVEIPLIYKLARKCMWDEFERCLITSPNQDINFVYSKDGTTVMHIVVMSRTGYIDAFKSSFTKRFAVAPDGLLERLLRLSPQLAKVQCTLNGYTPLTYACLVCDAQYPMESAASMVRLLLDHSPDSIHFFSNDGLSPVDVHVVSYSYHHPDKEDKTSRGRSSVTVLRALLSQCPELARNRLQGDKIQGPLELLYKCNSRKFSQATLDEMTTAGNEDSVHCDHNLPERRQSVVDEVKKWWIWTWTVMLLKYGSESNRKWGTPFAAVHAAAMQIGCPSTLMKLLLFAFPGQAKETISDKLDLANFPLHAVCSWPCGTGLLSAPKSLIEKRKSQAIAILMEAYPDATMMANSRGDLPLELASKTDTTWEGGIRRLVKAHRKALCIPSRQTGMHPFLTSAVEAKQAACADRHVQSLRTIYGLLRSNPKALIHSQEATIDENRL